MTFKDRMYIAFILSMTYAISTDFDTVKDVGNLTFFWLTTAFANWLWKDKDA